MSGGTGGRLAAALLWAWVIGAFAAYLWQLRGYVEPALSAVGLR